MRQLLIYSILLLVFISTSCKSTKKVSKEPEIAPDICESIIFTDKQYNNVKSDYYSVDTLFIDNNCLNIWVTYSGGCGDAKFKLIYNNKVLQSMPPKTNLFLQFTDNDNCRAEVQQKLYYNLSFFEEHAENGGISLRLSDIGKTVLYKK